MFIKNIKDKFIKIFFPEMCIFCEKNNVSICDTCLMSIKNYLTNLEKDTENKNILNKIENDKLQIDWIKYIYSYQDEKLKKSIYHLKYYHNKSIAKYLSKIFFIDFYNFLHTILKDKNKLDNKYTINDFIFLPVPIHKKRLIERDYNQSELLLKETIFRVKEVYNLDLEKNIITDILIKEKNTKKLSWTNKDKDRYKILKNAFIVNASRKNITENKIIIIFDDIITTGTTFYEIRQTLIESNISKDNVYGFAICH